MCVFDFDLSLRGFIFKDCTKNGLSLIVLLKSAGEGVGGVKA